MSKLQKENEALPQKKRFIVRKYIMADSALEALKIEKNHEADDCFIDDEWIKAHPEITSRERLVDAIGFSMPTEEDEG